MSKKIKYTLFDKELFSKLKHEQDIPIYSYFPQDVHAKVGIDDDEECIFSHVIEHETAFYEELGCISGGIKYSLGGGKIVEPTKSSVSVPNFVEADYLQFISCDAKQVILLQNTWTHPHLANQWPHSTDCSLVVAGAIPRFELRRLLHRITTTFSIPVYVAVDNDTWGYFIASLLRRGLMAPHAELPYATCSDVRFLGLTTKDFAELPSSVKREPWNPLWKLRIDAMRRYACFQSDVWQREFDQFERQQGKVEFDALIEPLGVKWIIEEVILKRIAEGRFLRLA